MKLIAAALVALAAGLAGCGGDEEPARSGPLVVYERAGGFAPQPHRLVVDRAGTARLREQTGPDVAERRFELTDGQLEDLEAALDDARGVDAPGPAGGCADCFEYTVRADGVRIRLDSVSYGDDDTPAELRAVVGMLERLAGR